MAKNTTFRNFYKSQRHTLSITDIFQIFAKNRFFYMFLMILKLSEQNKNTFEFFTIFSTLAHSGGQPVHPVSISL